MAVQTAPNGAGELAPGERSGGTSGSTSAGRVKAPVWTRLAVAFGVVLTLLSVGGIVSVEYFVGQLTGNIQTTSSVLDEAGVGGVGAGGGKLPEGAMNLLMLGLDTRAGWDTKGELSRSDTILVLHITAAHDQAYMISIPRDMRTAIPADKSMNFGGLTDRINSAYAYGSKDGRGWTGGAKLATKAVHELTGMNFDGVVVIDFDGFRGILEAMGGVHLCVDKDMWSSHYTVDSKGKLKYAVGADPTSPPRDALWFRKGCRDMAPWEALEYSRLRHSANGDYDRQRHQQQLLRAMAKKATSSGVMANPAKVSKLLEAAGSSLKMDTHGVPINDFVFGLKGLAAADLIPIKTNGGTFATAQGGGEGITPITRQLFQAAAADRLGDFLVDHPQLVINDGGGKTS
ncbi:LCP family protein [Micromonosporaceae bacterium Da 78-11]